MSKSLRNTSIVIGVVVSGAALLLVGLYIGRVGLRGPGFWPEHHMLGVADQATITSYETMMESSMMGSGILDSGMMGSGMMGSGMMGSGMMGSGMMGSGMMGSGMMMGTGMMGSYTGTGLLRLDPLSLEDSRTAVERYLTTLEDEDLAIGEIMIFDNHAYAQIIETSTGFGAFEVLVDPVTLGVSPEPGPTMMWNLKYSTMGMMGGSGMMGFQGSDSMDDMMDDTAAQLGPDELPVSLEEAVRIGQRYLDAYLPGTEVEEHTDPFYGYYTLHVLRDGQVVGMLSVNGFSNAVILHTWHGDLLEIAELD
jgi:hypothetical protein